jgi:hypothetical protein
MKRELSLGDELFEAHRNMRRERKQARTQSVEVLLPRNQPGDDKGNIVRAITFIEKKLRESRHDGSWRFNLVYVKKENEEDDDNYQNYPVGFPGWSTHYQELPEKTQCLMAYRYCRRILKHFLKIHPEWKRVGDCQERFSSHGPRVQLVTPIIGEEDIDDDDWDTSVIFQWD